MDLGRASVGVHGRQTRACYVVQPSGREERAVCVDAHARVYAETRVYAERSIHLREKAQIENRLDEHASRVEASTLKPVLDEVGSSATSTSTAPTASVLVARK